MWRWTIWWSGWPGLTLSYQSSGWVTLPASSLRWLSLGLGCYPCAGLVYEGITFVLCSCTNLSHLCDLLRPEGMMNDEEPKPDLL